MLMKMACSVKNYSARLGRFSQNGSHMLEDFLYLLILLQTSYAQPWQLKLRSGNACVWDLLSNALYMKGLNLKCIYVYRPVSLEVRRISLYNFTRRCKRQRSLYKAEEKKSTIVM